MHRLARKAKIYGIFSRENRVKLHKYLKNIDKKRSKNGFSACGQWISALFVVMICGVKNKNRQSEKTVVVVEHWQRCSERLKEELPPQQFGTWIRPLRAELEQTNLRLYAPNKFILDWVKNKYLARISDLWKNSRARRSECICRSATRMVPSLRPQSRRPPSVAPAG